MSEEYLDWSDNEEAAHKIFDFFGALSMGVAGGGPIYVMGDVGGKTLVLTCPQGEPRTMGLQYLDRKEDGDPLMPGASRVGKEGALLYNCLGLHFSAAEKTVRITGDKAVVIVTERDIISVPRTSQWE